MSSERTTSLRVFPKKNPSTAVFATLSLPLRLKIMRAHVEPILTTFCRSRSWTKAQLQQVKRAQAYALRRAFGLDRLLTQEWHISDKAMLQAAEWEPITKIRLCRRMLCWGHCRQCADLTAKKPSLLPSFVICDLSHVQCPHKDDPWVTRQRPNTSAQSDSCRPPRCAWISLQALSQSLLSNEPAQV